MKYLKTGTISNYAASSRGFAVNPYGRIVTDSKNSLQLPSGTSNQRPDSGVVTNGTIRFNTETQSFEGFLAGGWEVVKSPSADTITKQTIAGHATETLYGPLDLVPSTINNILVIVENVIQVAEADFELIENPLGTSPSRGGSAYPSGTYIRFPLSVGVYESVPVGVNITILYGFDA